MKYLDKNKFRYFVDTEFCLSIHFVFEFKHTIKFNRESNCNITDFKLDRLC